MINWLLRRWYAHLRIIDIDILWSQLRAESYPDLQRARSAFAIHAYGDRAWRVLGTSGIDRIVKDLY